MRKLVRFIILFGFALPALSFINANFLIDSWVKLAQNIVFSFSLASSLTFAGVRKYHLILSLVLIVLMVGFFTFKFVHLANILASTAFGIINLTILSYLPTLFKRGYIEKV